MFATNQITSNLEEIFNSDSLVENKKLFTWLNGFNYVLFDFIE